MASKTNNIFNINCNYSHVESPRKQNITIIKSGDYPSRGAPYRGTSRPAGLYGTPLIGVTPRPAGTYEAGSPQIGDDSPSRGLPSPSLTSLPFLLSSSHQVWRLFFQGLFDCHRLLAVKHTPTSATTDSSAIRCYYCIILEIKVIYK